MFDVWYKKIYKQMVTLLLRKYESARFSVHINGQIDNIRGYVLVCGEQFLILFSENDPNTLCICLQEKKI